MNVKESIHPRKTTPGGLKEQLHTIVDELRSSMHTSAPRPGLAVIGTGMMGREHIRAVLQLGQATIVGLFDSEPNSIALALREFSTVDATAPRIYNELDELISDARVDAILICTPNFTHRRVFDTIKASGKAIFLEKPMATTLDDAIYLANECLTYPAPILLGMQYRYKSQYQLALKAIANGDIGDVKMLSICEYRPPFLSKVNEWNKFSAYSGGTLVEKCCHYFDLMNRVAGALPARVFATGGRAVNFTQFTFEGRAADIDDHALVIVEYENGVRAQFALNMFSEELLEELIVSGDRGIIRTEETASFKPGKASTANIKVEVPGHDAYDGIDCRFPEDIEMGGHYGSTLFEHRRFIDLLSGAQTDGATCAEGLWAIITAWMAQESMKTGSVVDVRETLSSLELNPYVTALLPVTLPAPAPAPAVNNGPIPEAVDK